MKLAAVALLLVVVYAAALGWSTGVWAAVAASIAAVLAVVLIGAPVFLPGYLIIR